MNTILDFEKISTNEFYNYLKSKDLFKSHLVLKDNIDMYKQLFNRLGLSTLSGLYNSLKTKKRMMKLIDENDLNEEYIVILRRHIMSFVLKTRNLSDFTLLSQSDRAILIQHNINDTKELQMKLYQVHNLENKPYLESMISLTSLRYVSALFAEAIYLAGYKNMEEVSKAIPLDFMNKVNQAGKQNNLFKVTFGLSDSKFVVDDAILYMKWLEL